MTMIALMAMSFVSSCSKEDDKGLVGTSWKGIDPDSNAEVVFLFQTETTFKVTMTHEGSSISFDGTYSYKEPNITATIDIENGSDFSGTVNGNTMTLTNQDDETIVLHKQ